MTVTARFEFKEDRAPEFCYPGTNFAELEFDDVEEVIAICKEFEKALCDVTVSVNNKVVALSDFNAK